MAGTILATPANQSADWSSWVTQVQRQYRGYAQMSLSSMSAQSVLEPKVQSGSCIEIGGSLYQFSAEESATGWSGISSASSVYVYCVPAGTVCSVSFSTTVPVFSDAKQGFYSSNDRAFAWLRKDSTAGYRYKHFLPQTFIDPIYFENELEIGEWNMDATAYLSIVHEISKDNIRKVETIIRNDNDDYSYIFGAVGDTTSVSSAYYVISADAIIVYRSPGGIFDSAGFNATVGTVLSRGRITMTYKI